ncbi:hypothetical protein BH20ACT2_BH20ACT2_20010 [soil metagenome]
MVDVRSSAELDAETDLDRPGPRRRPGTIALVAVAVGVVLAVFIVVLATRDPSSDRTVDSPLLGRLAPAIVGETVDGGRFDLDDHQGRFVLVNFFASWCVPCIREHPELVSFAERHARAGDAEVVSVVFGDEVEDVRAFFDEQGGDWPVVTNDDGRLALEYAVAGVPESYLIAPDGTVIYKIVGGVTSTGLDRLLAEAQEAAS